MKIAFTMKSADATGEIDPRFGRAHTILITDGDFENHTWINTDEIHAASHGAGPKMAQLMHDQGVTAIVTGNGPGQKAAMILKRTGIKVYSGAGDMSVRAAFSSFTAGTLPLFPL